MTRRLKEIRRLELQPESPLQSSSIDVFELVTEFGFHLVHLFPSSFFLCSPGESAISVFILRSIVLCVSKLWHLRKTTTATGDSHRGMDIRRCFAGFDSS